MIESGDIHLADLREERRRRVLVISNARFNGLCGRALVAPEIEREPDEVLFPWRVLIDDTVYAVDLARSIPLDRLLGRANRAPAAAMTLVRQAILNIT
jgi:mRNA-degrading endonuclease toxin of MazEF toxin-antitoxin module